MSGTFRYYLVLFFMSISSIADAQDYPYEIPQFPFIRYDDNQIENLPSRDYFYHIFDKINELNAKGKGKINIVHIGDSHIQADVLTHRMRTRLQNFVPGAYGSIGYVFPYLLARTNNPINYYVKAKGNWIGKTNIKYHPSMPMGVGGAAVKTMDSNAILTLIVRKENGITRPFDKVTVFFAPSKHNFDIKLKQDFLSVENYPEKGYATFYLKEPSDTLIIGFSKNSSEQTSFILNGFSLETSYEGIAYHAMGINGADVPAWLSSSLLESQLRALDPDLFVMSLGTNDLYTKSFDSASFARNYRMLIGRIKSAYPDVPIIVTTPGDHYLYRRYLNKSTPSAVNAIKSLSEEMGFTVWDFFHIMGGHNSIILWTKYGLTSGDKLHYNRQGYLLQGDLFFNAFLKQWDKYIDYKRGNKSELSEQHKLENSNGL